MARVKLCLRWESGDASRRFSFRLPRSGGDLRGEVDDSAAAPIYAVQNCVVDTSDGRIVLPPTNDKDGAEELAARLNGAALDPPSPGREAG